MKGTDEATLAESVDADRPTVGHAAPTRRPEHFRVTEDVSQLRAEIERQRRNLARAQATIDELRRSAAQAAASVTAEAELLAEMSHELHTPLNAIIGFSEIMRSEALGPVGNAKYRDYLDDIIFCGRHLLGIIDDALDLTRHKADHPTCSEPVALGAVIDEAIRLIVPLAERAGVALRGISSTTELPCLYGNRRRLRQILLNILSNAVKFTESGGKIEVTADASDGIAIVISDTGIGIAPEDIPFALSRFGQIASSGSRKRGGAGLGLTLAKALTEQHGGTLSLDGAPCGAGTSVRISFPPSRIVTGGADDHSGGMSAA
jgi:two-component system, cell cycle sensor histidine kinase PleC